MEEKKGKKQIKIVRAVFDNLDSLSAEDIESSEILRNLLKIHAPEAIESALNNNKIFASVFEINTTGCYLEIHRDNWISTLDKIIVWYTEAEDYRICAALTKLKHEIEEKKKKKRTSIVIKSEPKESTDVEQE